MVTAVVPLRNSRVNQPAISAVLSEKYTDALFVYTPWAGVLSPYGLRKEYTGTLPTIQPSVVGQIGNFGGTQFIEVTGTSGAFPNGFSVLTVAAPKSTAGSANIDLTVGRPGGYLNFGYFEFVVFNRYANPNSQVVARGKPSAGDTFYSFYSSGVKLSSLTTTADRYYSLAVNFSGSFDASSNMRLGCPTDSNGQPNIALTVVFPRLLSEAELQALSANPWQIFQQSRYVHTDSTPSPTSRTFFVPRKKVMSSQPQGNIQINWDNPITRGLACVYIPQISPQKPIDPVSGAVAVNNFIATRLPDVLPANGGSALVTNSITGDSRWGFAFDIPNAPAGRTGYPVLSIFSRCEILNTTGEGVIWGAGQALSPSSNIFYALRFNKFNDKIDLVPSSNAGGTITGPTFSTNRVYNLGGIQRFTNNFRAYYIDGALYGSNTSNFNNLNGGFQAGSAYTLNATSFQAKIYCGYVWQRELTAAEMQSLSDNPWQIFKQPRLSPALAEDGKVYAPFMS